MSILFHVLLSLTAILVVGRLIGALLSRLGQPRVMGEMLAGILLGPTLLGRIWPQAQQFLLPAEAAPTIGAIAQVGVVIYMFLVGLELTTDDLRGAVRSTLVISAAGIVVPFVFGIGLALWLFPSLSPAGVSRLSFSLFLGISLAITAFPVLARILTDLELAKSSLGVAALQCAAASDLIAWCLLAMVLGTTNNDWTGAIRTIALAGIFAASMFVLVRPLADRWLRNRPASHEAIGVVLIGLLVAAMISEAIGIHAVFGAFLLGAVLPHDAPIASGLRMRLADVATVLLLPAFFAYTGMRTEIGLMNSTTDWLICGVIVLAATFGKVGSTYFAARLVGKSSRVAACLGVLMNTRGLMELIVLNIGLELGVISPRLYAMLVVMALVTTFATTPILKMLLAKVRMGAAPEGEAMQAEVSGRFA